MKNTRRLIILFFLTLLTSFIPPCLCMESQEYAKEITCAIQILESIKDTENENKIELLKEKVASWKIVTLEGVDIKTDHEWLRGELGNIEREENPEKRKEISEALIEKLKNLQLALEPPELAVPDPQPLLSEILKRREFSTGKINFFLMRVLSKIHEWLERFFKRLHSAINVPTRFKSVLEWFFYSIIGILFLIALLLLIRKITKKMLAFQKKASIESPNVETAGIENSRKLREKALEYAKRRDYRLAVRYLYLSTLVHLDEKGIIQYDSTETNLECLRKVSIDLPIRRLVETLTGVFDRCWYGQTIPDSREYIQFLNQYEKLLKES